MRDGRRRLNLLDLHETAERNRRGRRRIPFTVVDPLTKMFCRS